MAVWHIVVLYLAVFGLLQFAVYRYLRGNDEGQPAGLRSASKAESGRLDERRADPPVPADPADHRDARGSGTDSAEVRLCPECGARNEVAPEFTYCHGCISPLGR